MLIRYTGNKSSKIVQFSTGDQREYEFIGDKPLEVTNSEHLRFFLHYDRKGLFEKFTDLSNKTQDDSTQVDQIPKSLTTGKPGGKKIRK